MEIRRGGAVLCHERPNLWFSYSVNEYVGIHYIALLMVCVGSSIYIYLLNREKASSVIYMDREGLLVMLLFYYDTIYESV